MYGSPATSRDLNLTFQAASLKHGKEVADLNHHHHPHHHHHHHQQQQTQMSAGLLRYRSAPSSMLGELTNDFLPHRSSSPEAAETMFARFMSPDPRDQIGEKPPLAAAQRSAQLMPAVERGHACCVAHQQNGGFSSSAASQMAYHPLQRPQQLPAHRAATPVAAMHSSPFRTAAAASVAVDNEQVESGVNGGNLVRQSSSPTGLFSHLGTENGYATMRGMFRPGAGSTGEAMPEGSRLKGQINFSSRQSSTSGLMSPISEIAGDRIGGDGPEDGIGGRCFIPGLPVAAWDDSSFLADGFTGSSRRARDPSEAQNGDARVHVSSLSHHFSFPRTSSEMASILQFQDAVPCKIRAKRGCATHPRSIAERVRRTRISERMRKLQELVPNMDKQTSTADMLDLAVEYIKDLQKQVKSLSESRASCTCSSKHKPSQSGPLLSQKPKPDEESQTSSLKQMF